MLSSVVDAGGVNNSAVLELALISLLWVLFLDFLPKLENHLIFLLVFALVLELLPNKLKLLSAEFPDMLLDPFVVFVVD